MTFSHSVDENIADPTAIHQTKSGMGGNLLIPVDFSDSSMIAVNAGFTLSQALGLSPVILHAYPQVMILENGANSYLDSFDQNDEDIQAAIEERDLLRIAKGGMVKFTSRIRRDSKAGRLPNINFSSVVLEGSVEEVILQYCKENNPRLVVMATRGIHKKHSDLIGSVTAEVLDNCRVPVFTVPDNYKGWSDGHMIHKILMFCSLDKYDVSALDGMMNTFNNRDAEIWLMPVEGRKLNSTVSQMSSLYEMMSNRWTLAKFHITRVDKDGITPELDSFLQKEGIQMLIAPNKKKGIFRSLFSPSVAHRCLFAIDLPMLALPVK